MAEKAYDRCHCPDGMERQLVTVLGAESRLELLASIRVPTLVIHGQDDPLIPVEAGIDERRPGGLGIYLVRSMVDDLSYDYETEGRRMRITVTKTLEN